MFDTRESFRDTSCTDIHAVNKIRLSDTISSGKVAVPGYTLKRSDRNRDGGGVSLYILNTINYELNVYLISRVKALSSLVLR